MKIHTTGSVGYNIFGEWEDSREVQSMDTTNRVEVFMLRDYVMAEKAMARAVRLHRTALQREMHSGFGKMAESMMKGAMSPPASVTAPSMTERLGRIDTLTARGALSNVEVCTRAHAPSSSMHVMLHAVPCICIVLARTPRWHAQMDGASAHRAQCMQERSYAIACMHADMHRRGMQRKFMCVLITPVHVPCGFRL